MLIFHIERGDLLNVLENPNQQLYPGQRIFAVNIGDYSYLVPCVESEAEVFLKAIIPSRKAMDIYLRQGRKDDPA